MMLLSDVVVFHWHQNNKETVKISTHCHAIWQSLLLACWTIHVFQTIPSSIVNDDSGTGQLIMHKCKFEKVKESNCVTFLQEHCSQDNRINKTINWCTSKFNQCNGYQRKIREKHSTDISKDRGPPTDNI